MQSGLPSRSPKKSNRSTTRVIPGHRPSDRHNRLVNLSEALATSTSSRFPNKGCASSEIAVHVGMPERTVRHWLSDRGIPYTHPRRERPRLIDPYKTYLLSRWHQGGHNGLHLERELRAKGYKGSGRALYRYLETLEPTGTSIRKRGSTPITSLPNPLLALSASQATWLFFRRPEDLKPKEQETLRQLRQASPRLETAYQLVEAFLHMVRERTGEQLDAWLEEVQASHLEAFRPL